MQGTDRSGRAEPSSQLLEVVGMSCSHCESAVSAALSRLAGVTRVAVDVPAGTVLVESREPLDMTAVAEAIDDAGYELRQ